MNQIKLLDSFRLHLFQFDPSTVAAVLNSSSQYIPQNG